jgi:hypothetical protein
VAAKSKAASVAAVARGDGATTCEDGRPQTQIFAAVAASEGKSEAELHAHMLACANRGDQVSESLALPACLSACLSACPSPSLPLSLSLSVCVCVSLVRGRCKWPMHGALAHTERAEPVRDAVPGAPGAGALGCHLRA